MATSRDVLYQAIEDAIRDQLDRAGTWRQADPDDLVRQAMLTVRAGLDPRLSAVASDDAIGGIRRIAQTGQLIQIDGGGPWYRLVESDPSA